VATSDASERTRRWSAAAEARARGARVSEMLFHHPLQHLAQIVMQMPSVGNLRRVRCAFGDAADEVLSAVPTDNLNIGVILQPCADRLCETIWQHVHNAMLLQIDDQ
jgi:hypothetical protein